MIDEMHALEHTNTLELITLPLGKKPLDCRWIYVIKVGPISEVDHLKPCLVANGYT